MNISEFISKSSGGMEIDQIINIQYSVDLHIKFINKERFRPQNMLTNNINSAIKATL